MVSCSFANVSTALSEVKLIVSIAGFVISTVTPSPLLISLMFPATSSKLTLYDTIPSGSEELTSKDAVQLLPLVLLISISLIDSPDKVNVTVGL